MFNNIKNNAQDELRKANELRDQGNLVESIQSYEEAIRIKPNYTQAILKLAEVYELQKNWSQAVKCYEQMLEFSPNEALSYAKLARALQQQNKIHDAIASYQKAIALQSEQPAWVYRNLGDALNQDGKAEKAIAAYHQAIRIMPDKSILYAKLAQAMMAQNNIQEAINNYRQAIALQSEQPAWVYRNLGDALNQNGEIENAIVAYQQAIKINPVDSILQAKLKAIKLQKANSNKQINQNQLIQKSHKNLKVIEGKNNWLFLDNDSNQINQQLTGEKTFSETELFKWRLLLETRELLLNKYNISYCFLVVPNKGCVYSEYLPDSIKLSEDRCINQLINYLANNSFAKILYPLEILKEAKARDLPVYRLRDTHWTTFGAFIFYQYVMSQISKTVKPYILSESSVEFSQVITKISDLGDKLDINEDFMLEAKISNSGSKCIFNNNVKNTGNLMVFENINQNLPKAVLFGDSFSSQLVKFLAESFSRLVIVWQPNLDYSIILNEKPDIVISQQVERFLVKMPDDLNGLSNMERTNVKSAIASIKT